MHDIVHDEPSRKVVMAVHKHVGSSRNERMVLLENTGSRNQVENSLLLADSAYALRFFNAIESSPCWVGEGGNLI